MANLSIFSQYPKEFDLEEDIKSSLKTYLPDLIEMTEKSVNHCFNVHEDYDPLNVSSWKASFTKGLIYKCFSTHPKLLGLVKPITHNNFILALGKYKFIVCKGDRFGNPEKKFPTKQSYELFSECNSLFFCYSVNKDSTYNDTFITCTNVEHSFVFSLSSELENIKQKHSIRKTLIRPKVKEIKKKKRI